ncbi:hypothetical protein [Kocuria rosea]|uniref:hypothetical protein n=1 Tax=Kocuria rosea TaxID=1275 RepID=UPI002B241A93|nr:hypothetical protein [Kocuria rosea]MEB2527823.1 hypothetical protein [Kocuria rosea]MEB2617727.1 hypothetical protein [Kocuria rosea]
MPNSVLGGDTHSSASPHDNNTGVWFDDDTVIPYLTRYRAKQSKALDRADIARWMKSPEVGA